MNIIDWLVIGFVVALLVFCIIFSAVQVGSLTEKIKTLHNRMDSMELKRVEKWEITPSKGNEIIIHGTCVPGCSEPKSSSVKSQINMEGPLSGTTPVAKSHIDGVLTYEVDYNCKDKTVSCEPHPVCTCVDHTINMEGPLSGTGHVVK